MPSEERGMDKNGFVPKSERFEIAKGLMEWLGRTGTITIRTVGRRNGLVRWTKELSRRDWETMSMLEKAEMDCLIRTG
jgi:hypothetical protein